MVARILVAEDADDDADEADTSRNIFLVFISSGFLDVLWFDVFQQKNWFDVIRLALIWFDLIWVGPHWN
jgi:hypothetical protein